MIPSNHQKLGSTNPERMISKYNTGSPDQISITRCPSRSIHPA
ncbi:hypothetical protein SRABI66_04328 [Stenotrophomonas lactitubi]|nr:hypothetical protein SRABI66_04328 [Stenotrophomonas lactitubi]